MHAALSLTTICVVENEILPRHKMTSMRLGAKTPSSQGIPQKTMQTSRLSSTVSGWELDESENQEWGTVKGRQVDWDVYKWKGPGIRNSEKLSDFHQVFVRRPSMMAACQPLRNQHLWQWLDHGLVQIQVWSASVSRTGVNYTFFATWMQFCNFRSDLSIFLCYWQSNEVMKKLHTCNCVGKKLRRSNRTYIMSCWIDCAFDWFSLLLLLCHAPKHPGHCSCNVTLLCRWPSSWLQWRTLRRACSGGQTRLLDIGRQMAVVFPACCFGRVAILISCVLTRSYGVGPQETASLRTTHFVSDGCTRILLRQRKVRSGRNGSHAIQSVGIRNHILQNSRISQQ